MKISTNNVSGATYIILETSGSWWSIKAECAGDDAYTVIQHHRQQAVKDLERLQEKLAVYNSALSVLEIEAMRDLEEMF